MIYVAWDIETCPIPLEEFTAQQQERYEKNLRRELEKHPEATEEAASKKVRSLSPFLGFICCISLVSYRDGEMGTGTSFAAECPVEAATYDDRAPEDALLRRFWKAISQIKGKVRWITFNGKRFDVPFLRTRSACHGIEPTRIDLLDTYPYNQHPHADLATTYKYVSLADVCDLLDVPSPKSDMDGSGVASAVQAGDLQSVMQYCERDARATMQCYLASEMIINQ